MYLYCPACQAKHFDWEKVWQRLDSCPELVNVTPKGRWSALHQAVFSLDGVGIEGIHVVEELFARGADATLRCGANQVLPEDVATDDQVKAHVKAERLHQENKNKGSEPASKRARLDPQATLHVMNRCTC